MRHSRNGVRRANVFALILISLLNLPVDLTQAAHRPHPVLSASAEPFESPAVLSAADQQTTARVSKAYNKLPLRFETNAGQADAQAKFLMRSSGYSLFLTSTETILYLRDKNKNQQSAIRMKLAGANSEPQIEGVDELPGKSNYFIGKDQSKWRRNVTSYAKVRYRNVYPGIDMIYYGNQQQLEYDLIVVPGADPNLIKLNFDGVKKMNVNGQGDVVLQTSGGDVIQRKPVIYQEVDGHRQEVAGRYVRVGKHQVGFKLGAYDRSQPLVIDPVLAYATFLGGAGFLDYATDVVVDAAGNAYVTGGTASTDFPTANPIQPIHGGPPFEPIPNEDVFIAKLNASGSALIYSTFLGGTSYEHGRGIAIDKDGNAYVVGVTVSQDFPTKNALQPALADDTPGGDYSDAFVAKVTADGSALVFSTYLGGLRGDAANSVAVDREGNIYLTGYTYSVGFPTKNPLQPALAGDNDVFVTKMKTDGSALIYSTFLGGSGADVYSATAIAVDSFGNAYVVGSTESTDFPTVNPRQATSGGDFDAFVTKLNSRGTALIYSTYLGGTGLDLCSDIAVDAAGNAYLTGITSSANFPTANPLQPVLLGSEDAFVTKLDRTGSALCYSTYLGGTDDDGGYDIAVDSRGRAYITGQTTSTDFPTLNVVAPMPDALISPENAFVTMLNARGSSLVYSTYIGGRGGDYGSGIALDVRGNVYVAGGTGSEDFPITPGAVQPTFRGPSIGFVGGDGFVLKIENRSHHRDDEQDDEDFFQRRGCECSNPER